MSTNQDNGNAAAMREALVTIRKQLQTLDEYGEIAKEAYLTIVGCIDAALSAPPRNCDRDLSDRQSIWAEFCQWVRSSSLGCASVPSADDAFEWLLAPAAERKGDAE